VAKAKKSPRRISLNLLGQKPYWIMENGEEEQRDGQKFTLSKSRFVREEKKAGDNHRLITVMDVTVIV